MDRSDSDRIGVARSDSERLGATWSDLDDKRNDPDLRPHQHMIRSEYLLHRGPDPGCRDARVATPHAAALPQHTTAASDALPQRAAITNSMLTTTTFVLFHHLARLFYAATAHLASGTGVPHSRTPHS